jgi:hypothetical protein
MGSAGHVCMRQIMLLLLLLAFWPLSHVVALGLAIIQSLLRQLVWFYNRIESGFVRSGRPAA